MANPTVREVICEAATDGLSPEVAAGMLLEPSKWNQRLFDPTRDLNTIYKQYLRGDLGVGVLADAVQSVLVASSDMADLTTEVVKRYGADATPGDVPDYAVEDVDAEDEQIEVLVDTGDGIVQTIVDHITSRWSPDLLEALYGDDLIEQGPEVLGPPRVAGDINKLPGQTAMTAMNPALGRKEPKQKRSTFRQKKLSPDTLQSFEQGKFFNNVATSAYDIAQVRQQIGQLYQSKKWPELADIYRTGGPLEQNLGMLAGDLMVLKDVVDGAVTGGYMNRRVGGTQALPTAKAFITQEAWKPALLDPELGNEISQLLQVLDAAQKGGVTYGQLQQQIRPFTDKNSVVYRLARRGKGADRVGAPFAYDQRNVQALAGQAEPPDAGAQPEPQPDVPQMVTQAAATEPEPEPEPEPEAPPSVPQGVEPLRTARDVMSLPDDDEELPVPPPEEPFEEPATDLGLDEPEEPQPDAASMVAQAAAGEEPEGFGQFVGDTAAAEAEVEITPFVNALGMDDAEAKQFYDRMNAKGLDAAAVAQNILDAGATLQVLGMMPKGWKVLAKSEPKAMRHLQSALRAYIMQELDAGNVPETHAMARKGMEILGKV